MSDLKIVRLNQEDGGMFGECLYNGEHVAATLEREWLGNKPFLSCVPAGEYALVDFKSQKYGETFCLVNHDIGVTPQKESYSTRYAILLHAANWPEQLEGCIAFGERHVKMRNKHGEVVQAVNNSRIYTKKVLDIIVDNNIKSIEIVNDLD